MGEQIEQLEVGKGGIRDKDVNIVTFPVGPTTDVEPEIDCEAGGLGLSCTSSPSENPDHPKTGRLRKDPRECRNGGLEGPHEIYAFRRWYVFEYMVPYLGWCRSDILLDEPHTVDMDLKGKRHTLDDVSIIDNKIETLHQRHDNTNTRW